MKYISILFCLWISVSLHAQQAAFPGAEGFGRFATGGRGGSVYHVTNTNDSGTGSFRDAVSQPNRIVVFDVSGVIQIKSRLIFSGNLTIAGQTAPGEGITIYGNGVSFSGANNLICRYIRFRMGTGGDSGKDAAGIANGRNMIFDHVSVSWGLDENFSISWDNKGTEPTDITIQNSIISQGLQTHSCGGLIQTNGGVTLFRNLYIDNKTRNPKVKGLNQFVNNVVYNWGSGGGYILGDSEGTSWATIVNNYFIAGPSTGGTAPYSRANENFQLYADGNYFDGNKDGILNGTLSQQADYGPAFWVESPDYWLTSTPQIPQMHPEITAQTPAIEAYNWIVDRAGCSLPVRDAVDQYVINELLSSGTAGALISVESELQLPNKVGYVFNAAKLPDSDNDGIPDEWEEKLGTDKNANDAMIIGTGGYAHIERYINAISEPIPYLRYPLNIRASGRTKTEISLTWLNEETRAAGLIIEISADNKNFTEAKRLAGNANSATVDGLEEATRYYFRLKTYNDRVESLYSDIFVMETDQDAGPPLKSTTPSPEHEALLTKYKNITLSWENISNILGGFLSYDVYLGKSESDMEKIALELAYTNHTIAELEPATEYYWKVNTKNLLGENMSDTWMFKTGIPIQREMVLHLPFNESSGNSAVDLIDDRIAVSQGFTPEWVSGRYENAVRFSGTPADSHMQLPHTDALLLDQMSFTISLWYKSTGGTDVYLLHKGSHAKNTSTGATGRWFGIQYKNSKLTFAVDDDVTKTNIDVTMNAKFDNEWHHLACVRDVENKKILMYADGVLAGEKTDATGPIGETSDLIIGNCNVNFNTPYTGDMDDLKIFDSALTAEEITDLYNYLYTGIHPVKIAENIKIFPNPFAGKIYLSLENSSASKATIILRDPTGRIIKRQILSATRKVVSIEGLESLPSGIYIYSVIAGNENFTGKVIKK
jgi:pectate lyase